jgi:hypothetical protein
VHTHGMCTMTVMRSVICNTALISPGRVPIRQLHRVRRVARLGLHVEQHNFCGDDNADDEHDAGTDHCVADELRGMLARAYSAVCVVTCVQSFYPLSAVPAMYDDADVMCCV